jgi:hypothetical protein
MGIGLYFFKKYISWSVLGQKKIERGLYMSSKNICHNIFLKFDIYGKRGEGR